MRCAYQKLLITLRRRELRLRIDDHTALATLASKKLEVAQFNRDRTSYHKSIKPYLVRDLEMTQLDKARSKVDRLDDKLGELTPFNLSNTFYLPLRGSRTRIVVFNTPMLPLDL